MNVLELSQQIYNDQQRLKANHIKGYAICPLYHYEQLTFSVSIPDGNYDPENPKYMYMIFNVDCELINHVGIQSESIDYEESMFSSALKQYLAQEVE